MTECIGFQQSSGTPLNGASSCVERPEACAPLYDEQELSTFQKLLDRELQLGAGRSLPSCRLQPAVDAASSQQNLQSAKSNALQKLFKRLSSVVRSTSKSSTAASSFKINDAASSERGAPLSAGLGPKTVIQEHHHHHHIYHIHHTPGGSDHHPYDFQAVNPTRRHSSDCHTRFDVPVAPPPQPTADAAPRRRFSSEVPRGSPFHTYATR